MKLTKAQRVLLSSSLSVFLVGCGSPNYSQSEVHLTVEEADSNQPVAPDKIPALVKSSPVAPALSGAAGADTYDVVVTNVPVRDLLFALARDAGIDMDVDDRVGGFVSISALDETLDSILTRIGEQVDIRVDTIGDALIIKPDAPYHKHYVVDHLNVERTYESAASGSGIGNIGEASVDTEAENNFWEGLEESIQTILNVNFIRSENSSSTISDDPSRQGLLNRIAANEGGLEAVDNNFTLNPETGVLVVYAPDRLQKEVQKLLDSMMSIAARQVLLEATVVEVVLNNSYAQGIDWSIFGAGATTGLALYQGGATGNPAASLAASALSTVFPAGAVVSVTQAVAESLGFTSDDWIEQTTTVQRGTGLFAFVDGDTPIASAESPTTDPTANNFARVENHASYSGAEVLAATEVANGLVQISANSPAYQNYLNAQAVESLGLVPHTPGTLPGGDTPFFTGAFRQGDLSAAVQLLSQFGDAKVLSSPRISALNYQPALLRVVDQEVYFQIDVNETVNAETGAVTGRTYSTITNVVDVGFSMNVLPFIKENGDIVLNLKPAVSRIIGSELVPASGPETVASLTNEVPVLRIREMESVIALRDGEIAVLGGLLEDRIIDNNSSVPGLSKIPGIGDLFKKTNETTRKTEFIVFIKAQIINNPSINADYGHYKHLLPDTDFINRSRTETMLPPSQEDSR